MLHWLAMVLREARQGSGITTTQIAADLSVSESTVNRFEKGLTWPQGVDGYLAVYSGYFGSGDGREYWARAIERWLRDGEAPVLLSDARAARRRVRDAVREASQRTQPGPGEPPGTSDATPRRREVS